MHSILKYDRRLRALKCGEATNPFSFAGDVSLSKRKGTVMEVSNMFEKGECSSLNRDSKILSEGALQALKSSLPMEKNQNHGEVVVFKT